MADIGFIGLGRMGAGMAANLLAAGHALRVFNRTSDKARPLVESGATLAPSPEAVATSGGVVITMLADDRALESSAAEALARSLGKGGVHISMSTVLPTTNQKLAEQHRAFGAALVAAPVFGRPEAAAAGKLSICLSGPSDAKDRVRPILAALGPNVFDFGEEIGAANVVKLAGNFLLMAAIESMAEASALAEKNGVPREALLNMLTHTLFNCPIYTLYGKKVINADFEKVGFAIPLAQKDMRLAHQTAQASSAPMPILSLLLDRYASAVAKGRSTLDACALALGAADDAGLEW